MTPIVILSGEAGTGKDTVAAMLSLHGGVAIGQADALKHFVRYFYDVDNETLFGASEKREKPISLKPGFLALPALIEKALGSPAGEALFDYVRNSPKSVPCRKILQEIGTDVVRNIDRDIWINIALQESRRILAGGYLYDRIAGGAFHDEVPPPNFVVITDGRFANEVVAVKASGGVSVRIARQIDKTHEKYSHSSEKEASRIPLNFFDYMLVNDGGIEDLKQQVGLLASKLKRKPDTIRNPKEYR